MLHKNFNSCANGIKKIADYPFFFYICSLNYERGGRKPPFFIKGDERNKSFYYIMNETVIDQIRDKVTAILDGSALFLTDINIKPTNNVKVFVDGDSGVTIDAVARLNRALHKQIEEAGWFPEGDFSLEVSSPGVDKPLKFFRQYKKNIGRKVSVTLADNTTKTGILKDATEERLILEETVGKKKETVNTEIPFSEVIRTVVQVVF